MRRRIIGTALSTIPAPTRRRTTNTSTAKRRNRRSTGRRADLRRSASLTLELASNVEDWPAHLSHYRYVRFRERCADGGGLVEMSANRPFHIIDTSRGPLEANW